MTMTSVQKNTNNKIDIDIFSVSGTGILGKKMPSFLNRIRTHDLPVTIPDVLLVEAKALN